MKAILGQVNSVLSETFLPAGLVIYPHVYSNKYFTIESYPSRQSGKNIIISFVLFQTSMSVSLIRYLMSTVTLLTIAMLMPTVPTLRVPSTARVILDTLEMASLVLVMLLDIFLSFPFLLNTFLLRFDVKFLLHRHQ